MINMKELMDHFGVKGQTAAPIEVWIAPRNVYSHGYGADKIEEVSVYRTYVVGLKQYKASRYDSSCVRVMLARFEDVELFGIEGAAMTAQPEDLSILQLCFNTKAAAVKAHNIRALALAKEELKVISIKLRFHQTEWNKWNKECIRINKRK